MQNRTGLRPFIRRKWKGYAGAALIALGVGVEPGWWGMVMFICLLGGLDLYAQQTLQDARRG